MQVLSLHLDHLGSLRQVTDSERRIVEDHDFLLFGEEITDLTVETLLFGGHERDSHTAQIVDDLDNMHAKYYSPHVGRFMSVDTSAREQYEPTRAFYLSRGFRQAARLVEFYAPGDD